MRKQRVHSAVELDEVHLDFVRTLAAMSKGRSENLVLVKDFPVKEAPDFDTFRVPEARSARTHPPLATLRPHSECPHCLPHQGTKAANMDKDGWCSLLDAWAGNGMQKDDPVFESLLQPA